MLHGLRKTFLNTTHRLRYSKDPVVDGGANFQQQLYTTMKVTTIDKAYDIPEEVLAKYERKPEPTWDRMEVLRGEWNPAKHIPVGREYFYIIGDTRINSVARRESSDEEVYDREISCGFIHFPTRELAEEYLLIAEGQWKAKYGDKYWFVNSNNNTIHEIVCSSKRVGVYTGSMPEFPSEKQAESYILKHKKPERPLVGSAIDLTAPDGTVHKATLQ